jgi:hypothetical protein
MLSGFVAVQLTLTLPSVIASWRYSALLVNSKLLHLLLLAQPG